MKKQTILLTALLTAATLPQQLLSQTPGGGAHVGGHHITGRSEATESGHDGGARSASAHSAVVSGNPGTGVTPRAGVAQKTDVSYGKNDAKSVTQLFGTPKEVNSPTTRRSQALLRSGKPISFKTKSGYNLVAAIRPVSGKNDTRAASTDAVWIVNSQPAPGKSMRAASDNLLFVGFGLTPNEAKTVRNGKAARIARDGNYSFTIVRDTQHSDTYVIKPTGTANEATQAETAIALFAYFMSHLCQ